MQLMSIWRFVALLVSVVGSPLSFPYSHSHRDFKLLGTILTNATTGAYDHAQTQSMSYYLSSSNANQSVALSECLTVIGGRLLTILTQDQDEKLSDFLDQAGLTTRVYTSGKFYQSVSAWEWTTIARPFDDYYSNWGGSNPSLDNYCCFKTGSSSSYRWRSTSCSEQHQFVCEINIAV